MQLLPHIPIFAYQLRNLFLQAIILLHQQLVHRCQFPVHSLEPWRLFSLLLSAPASPKHHKTQKTIQPSMKLKHTHVSWLQTQLKKQTFRPNSPPLLKKITNLSKDINSNRFGNAININIWFKVQTVALTKKERIYEKKKSERMKPEFPKMIPAILEPDLDLLGLDVGENGALSNQLLSTQRAGLWALRIDSLERLNLLSCVPYILASIKVPTDTPTATLSVLLSHSHSHFLPQPRESCSRATTFFFFLLW